MLCYLIKDLSDEFDLGRLVDYRAAAYYENDIDYSVKKVYVEEIVEDYT